ncbi:hypothetical protein A2714_02555 [Candidatus Woesebacteria bacterium RIFCSPHIGHO2_01_FULL_38_9]|uniref:Serine aminopeptidase S33 domain-containing protein n=2 Tax=Candidatus Woeseibacteriota TaxID=1752722 RepID=A0A1F7Y214_9BACT|nr:MAG: hypothetical protein A2714_02555 [Candidatus Woesebacteria bacterium RIFCSPHIGHO2_01_FULL_38_9]OGM60558.1 MAG: hypothetical protein A3A75_03475 [Candidatus Woesebacteria bacterium RIFCSPLOWO2_01_FULL_39_10]
MRRKVFIPNKKGFKLAVIIERPDQKGRFPTVLLFHGFKGYKEEPTYSELAKALLKAGIGSIRFDASGFGESEGDFDKEYRLSNYLNDSTMIYHSSKAIPWVDQKRLGVMGQSMGGALAIILASKIPEINAVVSVSPPDIFATKDDFGKKLEEWKEKGYLEIDSSRMGKIKVPYDYVLDAKKYDIGHYASKVKSPKLFILGLADATVDPEQTRAVYQAASEPKKLVEIEGMNHFYKNDPAILEKVNKYIVEFYKKPLL